MRQGPASVFWREVEVVVGALKTKSCLSVSEFFSFSGNDCRNSQKSADGEFLLFRFLCSCKENEKPSGLSENYHLSLKIKSYGKQEHLGQNHSNRYYYLDSHRNHFWSDILHGALAKNSNVVNRNNILIIGKLKNNDGCIHTCRYFSLFFPSNLITSKIITTKTLSSQKCTFFVLFG